MIQLNSFLQLQQINKYLRKQRENQKFLNYLEIASTFSLIAIFLFFAVKPTASAIFTLLGEIKAKETQSQQLKNKINSIVKAQDAYSQAQEKYDVIESCLPDRPNYYQSAVNITGSSDQTNASVNKILFSINSDNNDQDALAPTIDSYGVSIMGKSDYDSALTYIKNLLNSRRLIELRNIQFSKSGEKENASSNEIGLNFFTRLFYLKDKNEKN